MSYSAAASTIAPDDKPALYRELNAILESLLEGESDDIANLANASALLYDRLPGLNWAGFYLLKSALLADKKTDGKADKNMNTPAELVVGPFQGKPACTRIPVGKGVCGTALARRESLVVPDVHAFSGHIACDSASNSEIVIPLIRDGRALGVLDLDSPQLARFDEQDRQGLEAFVAVLLRSVFNHP